MWQTIACIYFCRRVFFLHRIFIYCFSHWGQKFSYVVSFLCGRFLLRRHLRGTFRHINKRHFDIYIAPKSHFTAYIRAGSSWQQGAMRKLCKGPCLPLLTAMACLHFKHIKRHLWVLHRVCNEKGMFFHPVYGGRRNQEKQNIRLKRL